jgi:predicted O-methyltransferase YrrM
VKLNDVKKRVNGVHGMTSSQAEVITDVIIKNRFQNILELGFNHGVSTCYMAGALDELGGGKITTIDLLRARDANPNVEQLLDDLGLNQYANVFYEPTSYIWRLMRMLEEDSLPRFDFCYIDGAHNWYTDGFAFFLVDRLLKPGGLIIFDDLDWTYDTSPTLKNKEFVKRKPQDERTIPQIRQVYELLVKPHPAYTEFKTVDDWAYARKSSASPDSAEVESRREIVYERQHYGLGALLLKLFKRITR